MKYLKILLIILFTTFFFCKNRAAENPTKDNSKVEIAKDFDHATWNELLQKHVTKDGHVDYKGFKNDKENLQKYIISLSESAPTNSWSKDQKLAYYINAYNALTIDLILRHYPVKSIKDIKDPWDQSLWKLGGKSYSLGEIEHDILRKMDEPRIHFAIVCASFSCPKLQNEAFTSSKMDGQLTNAAKEFLNDSSKNTISEKNLELSKIFKWFTSDFTKNGSVIDFINKYANTKISDDAKIRYKDYNWDLND